MLDAYIIEKLERGRREREDRGRVPLRPPPPPAPDAAEEGDPPEEEEGAVVVDFVI
jgi:hypothetical protein